MRMLFTGGRDKSAPTRGEKIGNELHERLQGKGRGPNAPTCVKGGEGSRQLGVGAGKGKGGCRPLKKKEHSHPTVGPKGGKKKGAKVRHAWARSSKGCHALKKKSAFGHQCWGEKGGGRRAPRWWGSKSSRFGNFKD